MRRRGLARALSVALAVAAAAPAAAAVHGSDTTTRLVRYQLVLPGLAHAQYLGAAPAGTRLTVGVGLLHPDAAGEAAALRAMTDPSSPSYRAFLSPAQYRARFGVPAAQTRELSGWLAGGGLAVRSVSASGDYVTATGTVAQVARLMHTSFGRYRIGGHTFLANQVGPQVPADLPVAGVLGLNTLQRVWTEADLAGPHASPRPASRPAASGSYLGTLVSADLRGAYDVPASDQGQGETAGVFGDGQFGSVISDLRMFEGREHLPQVPVRTVLGEGGDPVNYADNAESVEWMLDSQAITGTAPQLSRLDLYFAPTPLDADMAATIATWAGDPNGPKQMNASFSECESDPTSPVVQGTPWTSLLYGVGIGNQFQLLTDASLRQAALEGRTLFAAAGDTGGSCPFVILPVIGAGNGLNPQPNPSAGYPADSAYATGVGGTVLTTNGTAQPGANHAAAVHRVSEVSWVFSGGGSAASVPEPAWQQQVAAIDMPCTDVAEATPGDICRGAPDVAAMSGQGFTDSGGGLVSSNGYEMSADGLPFPEGGTSLASPLTVGMWADIQAAAPFNPKTGSYSGLGFAPPLIYRVAQSPRYHDDFYDITDSDVSGAGNITYQNAPGWDYVSGWGVMDVAHLIADPLVDHNPYARPTHPVPAAPVRPSVSCRADMTSPQGNAYDFAQSLTWPPTSHPELDITNAALVNNGDGTVTATIYGPQLSPSQPTGALLGTFFYVLFQDGTATRFLGATVDQTGTPTYVEGHTDMNTADEFVYVVDHKVHGSFTGGRLTVTAPAGDLALPRTAVVTVPYAISGYSGFPFVNFASDTATAPDQAVRLGPC